MKYTLAAILVSVSGFPAQAQFGPRPTVRALGQASVSVPPDQAQIDVNVTTQGATAQEASGNNAKQATAVLAALGMLLGPNADLKTINYFVGPIYKNATGGGPEVIVGYNASSTVEITLSDLSFAGPVIDTATQAGATWTGGLRFALKNSDPAHIQALRAATLQARAHADSMAMALGRTVGAVTSIQEAAAIAVQPIYLAGAAAATNTPVEPGLIQVQASVTLDAELN